MKVYKIVVFELVVYRRLLRTRRPNRRPRPRLRPFRLPFLPALPGGGAPYNVGGVGGAVGAGVVTGRMGRVTSGTG